VDLKVLEEQILAPRIGFIQNCKSFVDTQKKSKGRIVNVPNDVEFTLRSLCRYYKNLGVIMIELKKRLAYKQSVWQENVGKLLNF